MENFRAKKSLGQNFLTSQEIVSHIIDAADPAADDIVVEVGPGKGVLTRPLLKLAGKVIAIEKDRRLIEPLEQQFSKEINDGKLDLIEKDILEFDVSALEFYELDYKVVANIPYYITGQILRTFLTAKKKPELMVVMVQKEVAERIVARDEKESLLSLSVKIYGTPRIARIVPSHFFKPTPKVDSAILVIENISNNFFESLGTVSEKKFFGLLHAAFSSKRKKLVGNIVNGGFGNRTKIEEIFHHVGIDINARPENVAVGQWFALAQKLFSTV